jgi:hypothetical protein
MVTEQGMISTRNRPQAPGRWPGAAFSRLAALLLVLYAAQGFAETSSTREAHQQFPAAVGYPVIAANLDAATARARAENKLLMVVMGANWCHDSRAFIDRMAEPGLQKLVDERFVVERVNIGYFDYIRGVVQRWDVPVIYGTPTVLVVEPDSNQVLNRPSLAYWRNAESISLHDTLGYFEAFAPAGVEGLAAAHSTDNPAARAALAEIGEFERAQAERIYAAYAELGPLLRRYEQGEQVPGFMPKWNNLAVMRGGLGDTLPLLREQARAQAGKGGAPVRLEYPQYTLFND